MLGKVGQVVDPREPVDGLSATTLRGKVYVDTWVERFGGPASRWARQFMATKTADIRSVIVHFDYANGHASDLRDARFVGFRSPG
jgi:hypothetical protein